MVIFETAPISKIQNELSLWAKESDVEEVSNINYEQKRLASLCARTLLYKKLFTKTGLRDWNLKKDNSGKPFLIHDYAEHVPYISLSHSSTMVAIAISYIGSVGIREWGL